jgi:hypothetical protein
MKRSASVASVAADNRPRTSLYVVYSGTWYPTYTSPMTAATRLKPARPPGTIHTFSYVYLLSLPWRYSTLYKLATASRNFFTPVVGAYSCASVGIQRVLMRGGALGSSPTSGAPWPRFAYMPSRGKQGRIQGRFETMQESRYTHPFFVPVCESIGHRPIRAIDNTCRKVHI